MSRHYACCSPPPQPSPRFLFISLYKFCHRLRAQNMHLPIPGDLLSTWTAGIALLICHFPCKDASAISTLLPDSRVRDVGGWGQLAATGTTAATPACACVLCLWNSRSTPIAIKINGGIGGGIGTPEPRWMGLEEEGCLQVDGGEWSQVCTPVPGCH